MISGAFEHAGNCHSRGGCGSGGHGRPHRSRQGRPEDPGRRGGRLGPIYGIVKDPYARGSIESLPRTAEKNDTKQKLLQQNIWAAKRTRGKSWPRSGAILSAWKDAGT